LRIGLGEKNPSDEISETLANEEKIVKGLNVLLVVTLSIVGFFLIFSLICCCRRK